MSTDKKKPLEPEVKPPRSIKAIKRVPMSQKESALLKALLAGRSPKKACEEAGLQLGEKSAQAMVKHVKSKYTDSNGHLLVALENIGVDMSTIAQRIRDGLDATTTTKAGSQVIHVPDYNVRHKYIETSLDIMGARAPTKQVVEQVKTHEQTVAIVDGLRRNPEVLAVLRKRLEQREKTIITTSQEVESDGSDGSGEAN